MKVLVLAILTLFLGAVCTSAAANRDAALQQIAQLTATIESLRADIAQLKTAGGQSGTVPTTAAHAKTRRASGGE